MKVVLKKYHNMIEIKDLIATDGLIYSKLALNVG